MYKHNIHLIIIHAVNKLFVNGGSIARAHVLFSVSLKILAHTLQQFYCLLCIFSRDGGDFDACECVFHSIYSSNAQTHTHSTLGNLPDSTFIMMCLASHSCTYVPPLYVAVRKKGAFKRSQHGVYVVS